MRFPYQAEVRGGETRWLPYLPVTLWGTTGYVAVDALVDSGSEHNVFPSEIATELGIPLEAERPVSLEGIGGRASGILTVVEFQVGRYRWTAPTIFTEAIDKRGILGQAGFFAFFTVTFRFQRRVLEITRFRGRLR